MFCIGFCFAKGLRWVNRAILSSSLPLIVMLTTLTSCVSAEKEEAAKRDQEILSVFEQAISKNEIFDREYRQASPEGKAEIEIEMVQFDGEKLFPRFDHAVDLILANPDPKLLNALVSMAAQYKGGKEHHFFAGLARIYRKWPDEFIESFALLPYAHQTTLFDALQVGWKELLKNELHNDWTIELSNRMNTFRPLGKK